MRDYPSLDGRIFEEEPQDGMQFVLIENLEELQRQTIYTAPMPFVVSGVAVGAPFVPVQRHHLWFFGALVEIPISSKVDVNKIDQVSGSAKR